MSFKISSNQSRWNRQWMVVNFNKRDRFNVRIVSSFISASTLTRIIITMCLSIYDFVAVLYAGRVHELCHALYLKQTDLIVIVKWTYIFMK